MLADPQQRRLPRWVRTVLCAVLMTLVAGTAAGAAPVAAPLSPNNPFAGPSSLPYELPPFDRIRDSDYRGAFLAGMAQQRAQVTAIAHDPEPPSFENTI